MTTLSTESFEEAESVGRGSAASAQRRRVMQITWSLVAGGAETYALTLASGLDRRRYQVRMCGVDRGGALEPELACRNIPYDIMHRRNGLDWRLMWRMFRLFRQHRIQVIHTHHFNQLFYSLPAAKLLGIRVIHTEHSVEAYKKRRLRWALRCMSFFCRKITAIGVDGERTLLEQVGIGRRKLQIIRAAVDLKRFHVDRDQAREQLRLEATDRVITIVARLYPEKNHQLLLRAFARIAQEKPEAKLLIVGDGVEEQEIASTIARLGLGERVRMLGVRRDIPVILAASDAFVLCSDREGLPIAVLEAMAAGLPVIATRVGDLPQVVREKVTGLIVPPGDEFALAGAMAEVLADPERARRMGHAGRATVEAQYSLTQMVALHEELYGTGGRR